LRSKTGLPPSGQSPDPIPPFSLFVQEGIKIPFKKKKFGRKENFLSTSLRNV